MALDMDKLNAFVGQFVGDLGAAVHSGMVVIGEKLGFSLQALAESPLGTQPKWPLRPEQMNAMCANGWPPKLLAATSLTANRRASSA